MRIDKESRVKGGWRGQDTSREEGGHHQAPVVPERRIAGSGETLMEGILTS